MSHKQQKKEGVYAISMGIIHGNVFEHSLRVCHFVAAHNLGSTTVRFCHIGRARLSDHVYFYGYIDSSLVSVAAYFQPNRFKALTTL
jgi:hypothetical protein